MEATESPLDVLSRAATMVQDSSPPDYGELCFSYLFRRLSLMLFLLLFFVVVVWRLIISVLSFTHFKLLGDLI